MEYWREQGITPAEQQQQALIAELVRDIGLDLARDCPELREDDSREEFRERANAASRKLLEYIRNRQEYWRLSASLQDHVGPDDQPEPAQRSFLARAVDWLRGRP